MWLLQILIECLKMRHYVRHTDRGNFTKDMMLSAVQLVESGASIRNAAKEKGVNYKTLSRYVKLKSSTGSLVTAKFGYSKGRQVFSNEMESLLVEYIVHAARIFHGLTITELRTIAYDLAVANQINGVPPAWSANHLAGED